MILTIEVCKFIESCLKELSDKELQEHEWLYDDGDSSAEFVEVVCQLFDDSGLGDYLDAKSGDIILSKDLDIIMRELDSILRAIDSKIGAKNILTHPNWSKVLGLSSQALTLIQELIIENEVVS